MQKIVALVPGYCDWLLRTWQTLKATNRAFRRTITLRKKERTLLFKWFTVSPLKYQSFQSNYKLTKVIMPNLVAISLWSKFDVSLNFAKNAKTWYRKTPSRNVSGRFKIDRRETCQGFFFNKSLHFLLTLELTSDVLDNDIPIKIGMYTVKG